MNKNALLDREIVNIAYSTIGISPINTVEHYLTASRLGFNALKSDVRITKDNVLLMCHDPGFTFDENGRIASFDRENNRKISDMTADEVLKLEHSTFADKLGHYAHPCTFKDFVKVCRENGKICYPVIREEYMDRVIPALFEVIYRYRMENNTVINSMCYESSVAARKYDKDIILCYTLHGGVQFCQEHLDMTEALGNAVLCGFHYSEHRGRSWDFDESQKNAMTYAQSKGIRIWQAQVHRYSDYVECMDRGVTGFQITKPYLPYTRQSLSFEIIIKNGVPVFSNILGGDRYSADCCMKCGRIKVSNIRLSGSKRGFADGIMPLWLNTLPYELSAKNQNGLPVPVTWKDNALLIDADLSENNRITVSVTV